jgi:RNA polymerase sigma-70 factor (ECF subfamily)
MRALHAEHAEFVWKSLQRLGVPGTELEDLLQDVFLIVHKRLHTFDGRSSMQAWLWGICRRVAAAYRRRAHVHRECVVTRSLEGSSEGIDPDPEQATLTRQQGEQLTAILDKLDLDKRAVFVMFEIEELGCDEIASMLGIPIGTVHSRLHAARKAVKKAAAKFHAGRLGR